MISNERLQQQHKGPRLVAVALAAGVALWASPYASAEMSSAEAQARYQQERARCISGESGQDYATCLREAGAALQAARRGQLDDADATYRSNALERCKALPPDEAKDCRDRMRGQGTSSGSVKGGGIYREKTTTETRVLEPAPASSPVTPVTVPAPAPAPAPTN